MSSKKEEHSEYESDEGEYSQSEEEDFMSCMSPEQKKLAEERLRSYQEQFRVYNDNQKSNKILDVKSHLPNISDEAAQLAIDSCKNNELLAIKRLLEDKAYFANVTAMAAGEIPLNMDAIMYVDRRQELREALAYDPGEAQESDDSDNWEMKKKDFSSHTHIMMKPDIPRDPDDWDDRRGHRDHRDHQDRSDYDPDEYYEEIHTRRRGRYERRAPRLTLDDALIMLAGLRSNSSSTNKENANAENDCSGNDSDHSSTSSQRSSHGRKRKQKGGVSDENKQDSTVPTATSNESASPTTDSTTNQSVQSPAGETIPASSSSSSSSADKHDIVNPSLADETTLVPAKKQQKRSKSTSSTAYDDDQDDYTMNNEDDEDDYEDGDDNNSNNSRYSTKRKTITSSASKKIPVETLRQMGWSEARIKAFRNRERNPNQYYYRFNDPGEPQATGKWSAKDKALFLDLIRKRGVDYQWGIFSMNIPGRVGYQCSNFYRQLIKEGEIKDDNYTFDKNGKLVFKFRDKSGNSTLVRRNSRRRNSDLDDFDFDQDYEKMEIQPQEEVDVLPDYIDPMTMMPVVKPAISPYGHVMGYDSWVKVLNRNPKNTCPFTKKKLTRRSLVKLNGENIEEYRDKIIKVTGFETELHVDE